jgi:hypothetical protein
MVAAYFIPRINFGRLLSHPSRSTACEFIGKIATGPVAIFARNRFMKKLIRARVVPIISANATTSAHKSDVR